MTAVELAGLPADTLREALRLTGEPEPPHGRGAAARLLRETLLVPGAVRTLVDRAPPAARDAFVRLVADGPAAVEELLGRGWWGHGTLPPPLDWLQRRALIAVGPDGRVTAVEEARRGFLDLALDLGIEPGGPGTAGSGTAGSGAPAGPRDGLVVEPARSVVVAPSPAALDRALTVPAAGLRGVAPTVAVSERSAAAVTAALQAAGVALAAAETVTATQEEPALPSVAEDAVGPRAVRRLLERAVNEQRQVRLRYFASSRGGAATDRVVDPWSFRDDFLRGYCHLRKGERTFALDRVGQARLLPSAVEHPAAAQHPAT